MDLEDIYDIISLSPDICNLIYKYHNENILKIDKVLYKALCKYPKMERNIIIEFKHNNLYNFINKIIENTNNDLCEGHVYIYGNKEQILKFIKHPDIISIEFTNDHDYRLYMD
jgi:hypothetical protein